MGEPGTEPLGHNCSRTCCRWLLVASAGCCRSDEKYSIRCHCSAAGRALAALCQLRGGADPATVELIPQLQMEIALERLHLEMIAQDNRAIAIRICLHLNCYNPAHNFCRTTSQALTTRKSACLRMFAKPRQDDSALQQRVAGIGRAGFQYPAPSLSIVSLSQHSHQWSHSSAG